MLEGFKDIKKRIKDDDLKREALIKKARELLKTSKLIIYSIHRENLKQTDYLIKQTKKMKSELDKIAKLNQRLLYEGSYSEACQEYAEALCFYGFVNKKKIPSFNELKISYGDYLMGISDLTGELARRAVMLASKKNSKEVIVIRDFVDDIHGAFLDFDLRNGHVRKKADAIKWNLKKIEEIVYDIKVK